MVIDSVTFGLSFPVNLNNQFDIEYFEYYIYIRLYDTRTIPPGPLEYQLRGSSTLHPEGHVKRIGE